MQYIKDKNTALILKEKSQEYVDNEYIDKINPLMKIKGYIVIDKNAFRLIIFDAFIELYNHLNSENFDTKYICDSMTMYLQEKKEILSNLISDVNLVSDALYLLCVTFDELIYTHTKLTSDVTLLSRIFNQNIGGNLFFDKVNQYVEFKQNNEEILIIAYTALKFGFRGKYRIRDDSEHQIYIIMNKLRNVIDRSRIVDKSLTPIAITNSKKTIINNKLKLYLVILFISVTITIYTSFSWLIKNQVYNTNQTIKMEK